MKENGKFHVFLLFLTGILTSVMITMMWLGGSVNFKEFLSAGNVYDIQPARLQKNSARWSYDVEKEGYWLLKNRAGKRFILDRWKPTWKYLHITIRESSKDPLTGIVKYYGEDGKTTYQQPMEFHEGQNVILLNEEMPLTEMSIVFLGAQGEFVSFSEIRLSNAPLFSIIDFLKRFAAVFSGVMVILVVLVYLKHRFIKARKSDRALDLLLGSMQDVIRVSGDALGSRTGGRLYSHQRRSMRKFLFSLLIVWMMAGNVLGWLDDIVMFRYHVLVCVLLLFAVSLVSWEKPLKNQPLSGIYMRSWVCIWLGILLCDFFVYREMESAAGCAMFLAGSVFIFFWQNMAKPGRMFRDLMGALEITFFLATVYCMFFRMKLPAIDYNGMFKSPEELAMYGILMAIVFLSDMDGLLNKRIADAAAEGVKNTEKGMFTACLKNIVGGTIALFFVLRSSHTPGIFIFALIGILYLPILVVKLFRMGKRCRMLFVYIVTAAILAYACVAVVFISIKYVPEILDINVTYENELHLTDLQGNERKMFRLENPGSLIGVKTKDPIKLKIIWRDYVRRLNLFGHSGTEPIFYRMIQPYSGYLSMAYHHGIYILLPYIAFQIAVVSVGITYAFRKKGRGTIFPLFLGIAYVCFSFIANVEISWGHPLWLCFYLSVGWMGKIGIEENLGKEGLT